MTETVNSAIETSGPKEKLLELGKSAAKVLAEEATQDNEILRSATAIWREIEQEGKKKLKEEAGTDKTGWVRSTLYGMDTFIAQLKEFQPKSVRVNFAGESDKGVDRGDDPNEDSFFSGAKGQRPQLRLAEISANLEAYEVARRQGKIKLGLNLTKLASQVQLRSANENSDKIFAGGVDGLFIVADGVGGEDEGEVASQRAIQKTLGELAGTTDWATLPSDQIQQKIKEAVMSANKALFRDKTILEKNFGSTLAMAMVIGGRIYTANVGDSRVYLYEESTGNIIRLTEDHSLVGALVRTGQITEDESYTHPQRNEISRYLGNKRTVEVDVSGPREVSGKVKLLVCSDGVWEMVRDPQLKNILSQQKPSGDIVPNLVSAAKVINRGEDDITAVVAELNFN